MSKEEYNKLQLTDQDEQDLIFIKGLAEDVRNGKKTVQEAVDAVGDCSYLLLKIVAGAL